MRTHIVAYQQQARHQGAAQHRERGQLSRLPTARPAPTDTEEKKGKEKKEKKKRKKSAQSKNAVR
jgi:hypothetical protein